MPNPHQIPVGIDLGTTFSAIAYLDNDGRPCTITNSEGELTTPSVVFFDQDAVIVGTEADFAGENDIDRLARAAKRDMGGQRYRKKILNRYVPPEVIQSFVLKRLKDDAELKLGEFSKAVITVPAYFNEPRRKATKDAGEMAGLEVIDIINEPTAAALAYGVQRGFLNEKGEAQGRELVLVYDLGGGTFDVTLMEIEESSFTAIGTAGDVYLGGMDWDQRIFDFVSEQFAASQGVDFESDAVLREKLMNHCARAKKSLTARNQTVIRFEHEGKRFQIDISREQFEALTKDLLERTRLTTDRLLRDANLKWSDLTKLLLVGGSTRMPMVWKMLESESGLQIDRSLSPDESVAHGAAIYAGILMKHGASAGKGISVTNVNSHDLGVLGVDPGTKEPRRKIVIPKNHRLPAQASKRFQTSKDGQKKIVVQVVEGGTDEGQGSTTIGKCVVHHLPENIKKGTEVKVTFNYSHSGLLKVLAEIPALKLSADTDVDRSGGMNQEEIRAWKQRMVAGLDFLTAQPTDRGSKPVFDGKNLKQESKASVDRAPSATRQSPKATHPVADSPAKEATKTPEKIQRKKKETLDPNKAAKVDREAVPGQPSEIMVLGEEEKKPDVGASALDFLKDFADQQDANRPEFVEVEESAIFAFDDAEKKPDLGESVLNMLNENEVKKSSASGSALEDFLSELE